MKRDDLCKSLADKHGFEPTEFDGMTLGEIAQHLLDKQLDAIYRGDFSAVSGFHGLTRRIHLPDGETIYISDDMGGDARLIELYEQYGNLRIKLCRKEFGNGLGDGAVVGLGTIESILCDTTNGEGECTFEDIVRVDRSLHTVDANGQPVEELQDDTIEPSYVCWGCNKEFDGWTGVSEHFADSGEAA